MGLAKEEHSLAMKAQQRYGRETGRGLGSFIHLKCADKTLHQKHTLVVDVHVGPRRFFFEMKEIFKICDFAQL